MVGCCLMMMAASVQAQLPSVDADTLRVIDLQEVEVVSTRATKTTPVAYTNIGKEELKERNVGQDLP